MNVHATVVLVGEQGVIVTGKSGAGKTALALHLVATERAAGHFASLVCDDRADLLAASGRLIARAPAAIAGLVEVRGHGIVRMDHEAACVVALHVRLVDGGGLRMAGEPVPQWFGVPLAELELPCGDTPGAARAVRAALGLTP